MHTSNYRYATEINSRKIYDFAPLHGVVKTVISQSSLHDPNALLTLAEEICYFKGENINIAWTSCKIVD